MSLTLAIDTSTDVRAGLARDGVVCASLSVPDARAHAEQLMPLVDQALASADATLADVDDIVVGVGPGPFTGLRVGVVTATTLAFTLGLDARGVCSLDVVARQWWDADAPAAFAVVSDARRKEVYWAVYERGARVDGPFVSAPGALPDLPLAGPGAYLVRGGVEGPTVLDAGVLAASGAALPIAGLEPLYLRRPDAELPSAPKSTIRPARIAMRGPR